MHVSLGDMGIDKRRIRILIDVKTVEFSLGTASKVTVFARYSIGIIENFDLFAIEALPRSSTISLQKEASRRWPSNPQSRVGYLVWKSKESIVCLRGIKHRFTGYLFNCWWQVPGLSANVFFSDLITTLVLCYAAHANVQNFEKSTKQPI